MINSLHFRFTFVVCLFAATLFTNATQIFYESFEDPVVSGYAEGTNPTGWTSDVANKAGLDSSARTGMTGSQCVRIDDYPTGAANYNGALTTTASILSSNLEAYVHYTLLCDVTGANLNDDVTIDLIAGSTVVASVTKSINTVNNFTATQARIDFMPLPTHPNIGETLAIRLRMTAGAWDQPCYFDNLSLDAVYTGTDTNAPSPDPMTWVQEPTPDGNLGMYMTCSVASDTNWVEYLFTNTVNGHSSGWIGVTTWRDTDLQDGVGYTYMAKARDKSFNYNETAWSAPASNTADRLILFYDGFELPVVSSQTSGTNPKNWSDLSTGTLGAGRAGLGNLASSSYANYGGNQAAWLNVYNADPILQTTTNNFDLELEPGGIYSITFNGADSQSYVLYADLMGGTNVVMTTSVAPSSTDFGPNFASNTVTITEATPGAREQLYVRLRVTGGAWNQNSYVDNLTLIGILPPPAGTVLRIK